MSGLSREEKEEIMRKRERKFAQQKAAGSSAGGTKKQQDPVQAPKKTQQRPKPEQMDSVLKPKGIPSSPSSSASPFSPTASSSKMDRAYADIFQVVTAVEQSNLQAMYVPAEWVEKRETDLIIYEFVAWPNRAISAVSFLTQSFARARSAVSRASGAWKEELAGVSHIIVNHLCSAVTNADLYGYEDESIFSGSTAMPAKELALALVNADPRSAVPVSHRLLSSIADGDAGEEARSDLSDVVHPIMAELFAMLATAMLGRDSVTNLLAALQALLVDRRIAATFVHYPNWMVAPELLNGSRVEKTTPLGAVLSFGTFPNQELALKFANAKSKPEGALATLNNLRMELSVIRESQFKIVSSGVMADKKAGKEAFLAWLGQALGSNKELIKMQGVRVTTSSDGFLLGLALVLIKFCDPFLGDRSAKMKAVDPTYLQSDYRFVASDETQLAAQSEELDSWVDPRNMDNIERHKEISPGVKVDGAAVGKATTYNFITEMVFLTSRALHLGLMQTFQNYERLMKHMRQVSDEIEHREAIGAPERDIAVLKAKMDNMLMHKLTIDASIKDRHLLLPAAKFYSFLAAWLSQLADAEGKGPPLPPPSAAMATLPEYVLEDVIDFFQFALIQGGAELSPLLDLSDLMRFSMTFLGSAQHVKNPYVRAKICRLLSIIAQREKRQRSGLFNGDEVVKRLLMPTLMRFYVDIEYTGSHGQFFEKFNIRYDISSAMQYLWDFPCHVEAAKSTSVVDRELFVRFTSCLLTDAIFLLDESLGKLSAIRVTQLAMKDEEQWMQQDDETRQGKEAELRQNEKSVTGYMQLAVSVVTLLNFFTGQVPESCHADELVKRFADFLNHHLELLVGRKSAELRVEGMEKYHFRPKELLGQIFDIYLNLNLNTSTAFRNACGGDGRSYSDATYRKAGQVVAQHGIRGRPAVEAFQRFADSVLLRAKERERAELVLQDAPDEFLDPLLSEPMKDPVLLPSGNIVDRSVIARHLLSDAKDPFTRAPLSMDDLKPVPELKAKIEKWAADNGVADFL